MIDKLTFISKLNNIIYDSVNIEP